MLRASRSWLYVALLSTFACMNLAMLPTLGSEPPATGTPSDAAQVEGTPLDTALVAATDGSDGAVGGIRRQPFRYWRYWASRPLPVFPAFLFIFIASTLAVALIPGVLTRAQASSTASFWRSLLTGFLTAVIALVFARVLFLSEIGNPLALLLIALVQLGVVLGLAAMSWLIGECLLSRLGLSGVPWLSRDKISGRLVQVALGVALVSSLLLIPGVGQCPRVGIRLVMLIGALGFGGLVRSWRALPTDAGAA